MPESIADNPLVFTTLTAPSFGAVQGVDPSTVQAWMGHAWIATTNLYLHQPGTPADRQVWTV